jgi:hypothetical protein
MPRFFASGLVACPSPGRYSGGVVRRFLTAICLALLLGPLGFALAQPKSAPTDSQGPSAPAVPMTVLADQLVDLFPKVEGDVLEVQGNTVTLGAGRKDGMRPGLEMALFREGREIKHPKTGQVLGKTEENLGRVTVTAVQEQFSQGTVTGGAELKAGDRFRLSAGKIRLVLVPLIGGVRDALVETATQELVERLNASGRFVVSMGDQVNLFLAEQGIKGDEFLAGRGVKDAAQRYKFEHLLVLQFKRVQGRPFMEARFFSMPVTEPLVSSSAFVPPSVRALSERERFSSAKSDTNRPQAKQRSLLQRLLGGDLEPGSYSTSEIPLKEVARLGFAVLAMDIAVQPKDRIPRVVVSDGDRVYQYRIVGQKVEAEWSFSTRTLGRVFSLQLADLDGDGVFEVVGNRFHVKAGLNSFILTVKDGKPKFLVDTIESFLFAVDTKGEGVKQTLWAQRYNPDTFFTVGQADEVTVKKGNLEVVKAVRAPSTFRPMGATFSNIAGKDTRALALVDEANRLRVSLDGEDVWRSSTSVGGGYTKLELVIPRGRQGDLTKFYKIEPSPLAVDLDGDGIDELVVPQNLVKEGLLAIVFKGPAGYRLQTIETGFEGGITTLGAYRTDDAVQPTLVATVVRFNNFLNTSGETQIIMTLPQE